MTRLVGSLAPTCASPAWSTATTSTPRNDRTTDPWPPIRLVPPMTTAAIAASSRPMPPLGSAEDSRATWKTAPSAASVPEMTNVASRIRRVARPANLAAGSFEPTATRWRPQTVRVSRTWPIRTTATAARKAGEAPTPAIGRASHSTRLPMYCVCESVIR